MEEWDSLKVKMEEALKTGSLVEALSHLDALITSASSPDDVPNLLTDHETSDLPTLHYLARFLYREEDIPRLDKLIRKFVESGYDINTTADQLVTRKGICVGFTALLASVEQRNLILMECLLQHGARANICDLNGLSPCHWAILRGDLKCLEKLVESGGTSPQATRLNIKEDVLPLFHLAVDEGRPEILSYLLSKEELELDVNEEAVYGQGVTCMAYTPLGWAIRKGDIPIIKVLLKHPRVKLLGLEELHFCLEKGYTDLALLLLDYFSDEELISDKTQDRWALHSLPKKAFEDESRVEFTKKLILEYVRRGWDVNSLSTAPIQRECTVYYYWIRSEVVTFSSYSLLHLICLDDAHGIIKALVEESEVDINCKTKGDLELTPVQILLVRKQWRSAAYLIEKGADLRVRGRSAAPERPLTRVVRESGAFEDTTSLNAVELLLALGYDASLPLLDQVLAMPDLGWIGVNEFHVAVEGLNPVFIAKMAERCAKLISIDELSYLTIGSRLALPPNDTPVKTPTLLYLLAELRTMLSNELTNLVGADVDPCALADLIKLLVSLGYDINLFLERSHGNGPSIPDRLIDHILVIDLVKNSSNLLLRTLLQCEQFHLNLSDRELNRQLKAIYCHCPNLVENALLLWDSPVCYDASWCWENKLLPPPSLDTVTLLVSHVVLDLSEMVMDRLKFHFGYSVIFKMLYSAGAQFSDEFFTYPLICHYYRPLEGFFEEVEELKVWKDQFDRKEGTTLKHMCRLRVRKMMTCVRDLKMLDELPRKLKDYVMCKDSV